MSFTNFHGHTHYCDGKGTAAEYADAAIAQGMPVYGFSTHAPLPYEVLWTMKEEEAEKYVAEVAQAKEKYKDLIQIYTGLEVDYIPETAGPGHECIQKLGLDYTIGSVHFVDFFPNGHPWEIDGQHTLFLEGLQQIFKGDIQQAIKRYYALIRKMVQEDPPDIVGHLDKIKIQSEDGNLFSEEADWYRDAVEETLQAIQARGLIVEVNTRGMYKKKTIDPYPGPWVLERMRTLDIPIMLNSDAHHPREIIACFEETAKLLLDIGYNHCRILLNGKWQDVAFTIKGIDYASS
ncbi:histidinol-phosphatase [Catalinimonas niigatensis]|uniref:histidinol-phosphatase n=1 Tax=Catalinimonas niigatensis TaxID=1397264 RepID=UPI0026650DFA|nr:histidinol-phosphatase [Catalinimonas niigatensis]WPP50145.1 histidinol-phosphatase [Catalinimonas niigatensis]